MQSYFLSDITNEKAIWEGRKSSFLSPWLKPSCDSRNGFSVFLNFQVRTCYRLKIQMQVIRLTWICKIVIILAESDLTRSSSPTCFSKQHQATPACSVLCPVKFWVSPNVIPLGHLCQYFTTCGMIFFFFPWHVIRTSMLQHVFFLFCAALRRKSSLYLSLQIVVVNCSSNFPSMNLSLFSYAECSSPLTTLVALLWTPPCISQIGDVIVGVVSPGSEQRVVLLTCWLCFCWQIPVCGYPSLQKWHTVGSY